MQKKLSTAVIAGTVICTLLFGCAFQSRTQSVVKILSYNIFHGEDPYRKQPNLDSVAALINELKPDLVAFQEMDSMTGRSAKIYGERINYIQLLAQKTNMHGYFGKAMDYDGGGYGEGALTRKKAKTRTHLLPMPSGGEPRAAIEVVYPVAGHKNLVFAATHLCHEFMPNKIAQTQKLNELFANQGQPAILAGDLNFTPEEEPYQVLAGSWTDAAVTHGNAGATFPADAPKIRIDYFWLNKQSSWRVVDFRTLPHTHSDHRAILLTVEIK